MERLTTNKSVADMSMIELVHNSCYADDERNARYRDYEMEMDARDFARNLMVTLAKDELPVDDAEFDEEILDNLTIDPFFRCPWSDCVVLPQYVGNGRFEGKVERL